MILPGTERAGGIGRTGGTAMDMDKEAIWAIFEKTGSVDAYLLYNRLQNDLVTLNREEAAVHADKDRRPHHPGDECR